MLTDEERDRFRKISQTAREAKAQAFAGAECDIERPRPILDPCSLMPQKPQNGLRALSLFSGGGGLDFGFDRAGFDHIASYDLLEFAGETLRSARPKWTVNSGDAGDVTSIDWRQQHGKIDVLHGGPPCQPFSHAGRRKGEDDVRDMLPELVRAVAEAQPSAFVCENVAGLATRRFEEYLQKNLFERLAPAYQIKMFLLNAADFGVPQRRKRIFFVGFRDKEAFKRYRHPSPTHAWDSPASGLPPTQGARQALGLADIERDGLAPTIRSGLTGPRHTTSVVNSVTAARHWRELEIWPNGVAPTREAAARFPAKEGHTRLSIQDCLVLQGFPADWPVGSTVYKALGLIGNSVAPPMGYHVALSVAKALRPID